MNNGCIDSTFLKNSSSFDDAGDPASSIRPLPAIFRKFRNAVGLLDDLAEAILEFMNERYEISSVQS